MKKLMFLLVLALMMVPAIAKADSMTFQFYASDSYIKFHIPNKNVEAQLGIFNIHINDTGDPTAWPAESFLAFCVDLEHLATQNKTVVLDEMANWQQPGYPDYNGAGKYVSYLLNEIGIPTSLADQGAMQLAIWEILYEDRDLYSFNVSSAAGSNRGQAYVDSSTVSSSVINKANEYLSLVNNVSYADVAGANALWIRTPGDRCNDYQDFVTASPVPEPSTLLMLGGGLALIGAFSRRKLGQSKKS